MLIGDKQRFAVEIGEFWSENRDLRRVDMWAANRWLTCDDNTAHVGSFVHQVRRSIETLRSGAPLAPPVAGLTPKQMHRQAMRRHALTRWRVTNWGETTDNVGLYLFRVEDRLVITFEFWRENYQPAKDRGEIFVAELPEKEFVEILERMAEVLGAEDPRYQPSPATEPSASATVADAADLYGDQLQAAVEITRRAGFPADILGVGEARFVHAEYDGRAAELSLSVDEYFVDFYDTSEDGSEIAVGREVLEVAAADVVDWLSRES